MKVAKMARKWVVYALSTGGTMLLAACYGPARPEYRSSPVKQVRGMVLMGNFPVPNAVVCEKNNAQHCPMTQEDGSFHLRFEADGENHEICARPHETSAAFTPVCVMVPGDTTLQEVTIRVTSVSKE